MPNFFKTLLHRDDGGKHGQSSSLTGTHGQSGGYAGWNNQSFQYYNFRANDAPPMWSAAPESQSHTFGRYQDTPKAEYDAAEEFCEQNPLYEPRIIPSVAVDRIRQEGARSWGLEVPHTDRFHGHVHNIPVGFTSKGPGHGDAVVKVVTEKSCRDSCILSDLPIMAGMYETQGKQGVYYEVKIHKMKGIIAIGAACRPYPVWRYPGWNRLSVGLHLDDMRKFFEDASGGQDYDSRIEKIHPGDIVGFGHVYQTGETFFTYNGVRLNSAFTGTFLPRHRHDVFAAIGVEGQNEFDVNFGGDLFKWQEGNEWQWRVEGIAGHLSDESSYGDALPAYSSGTPGVS